MADEDPELHVTMLRIFLHMIHDEQQRMLAVIAGARVAEPDRGEPRRLDVAGAARRNRPA